ncbi:L-Aspartase-like protein [Melampsora americana]|nr:L-Aspartase-like protein [Melampsora americana]
MAPTAIHLKGGLTKPLGDHEKNGLKPIKPTQMSGLEEHSQLCVKVLEELDSLISSKSNSRKFTLDGFSLSPTEVVANARFAVEAKISSDQALIDRITESVTFLDSKLDTAIYGVTTGFGGSADTRTNCPEQLQISFLEHQLSGVLPLPKPSSDTFYLTDPMTNIIPEPITRGAILIRINSLIRGHSAVRLEVLETLLTLLNKKLTPMVPLRGTISASGDLMPLSYVAAAICGHPEIRILDRSSPDGTLEILSASAALAKHNIKPITLGPKEGLGISNGTAFSASAACLAAHDAHFLGLMSQVLTALTVEAMVGQAGNYHKFIHEICRPHPGQVETAKNIKNLLEGSSLAVHKEEEKNLCEDMDQNILRQDRYPLRTAPQWLGPQIEDLMSVNKALSCEINATTDNPLIDLENKYIHNGGNFQAMAVTNAMEKTRLALHHLGKLSFAQATEMINCAMNKGLPSCLAGDEPSTNYHVKGIDINMAAYTAELGFLASPVSTHVQSAEQHNQAVNSMAFVSARYTIQSVETLSMLMSGHLYVACMAIDLRVIDLLFRQRLANRMPEMILEHFSKSGEVEREDGWEVKLSRTILPIVYRRLEHTASMDSYARFLDAFSLTLQSILETVGNTLKMESITSWKEYSATEAQQIYLKTRDQFFLEIIESYGNHENKGKLGPSEALMGEKNRIIYRFVRLELGILPRRGDVKLGRHQGSVSSDLSKIYESMRSGELYKVLKDMF